MTGAGVKAGTEDCCRGQMAIGLASGSLLVVLTMTILLAGDVPFKRASRSQQPLDGAFKRRKSTIHSLLEVFVVAGCLTAAAQVMGLMVRFRCVDSGPAYTGGERPG
jgi:hypothetical protein